jgi:uncharacterized protein
VATKNFSDPGRQNHLSSAGSTPPPLLVDENLIGLARWLRFFGIDTSMAVGWKDAEVAAFARKKNRLLITRDGLLARSMKPDPVIRIASDETREQLKAVLKEVGVPREDAWFSRCVRCNKMLRDYPAEEAARDPEVPGAFDGRAGERFWRCDHCNRTYWRGSHFERTKEFLEGVRREVGELNH